jgi:uncharacterized membrane protein (UPF0127 family)
MRLPRPLLIALCAVFMTFVSCNGDDSGSTPPPGTPLPTATSAPTIELRHDGGVLRVEIADTPDERSTGLMHRTSLPDDAGMLFIYEAPRIPSFWMKNTLIPLDMIWIGADKRIVEINANVQPEPGVADSALRRYGPTVPVSYVLELNAGAAARLGLAPGSLLAFDVPLQ